TLTRLTQPDSGGKGRGDGMPKVVLGDNLPAFAGQQLQAVLPKGVEFEAVHAPGEEELVRCSRGAEVLVTVRIRVDTHVLALLPSVRLIQTLGVGYEYLDLAATRRPE